MDGHGSAGLSSRTQEMVSRVVRGPAAHHRARSRGRRRRPRHQEGRDAWPGWRVWLWEVDAGPDSDPPPRCERRRDLVSRRGHHTLAWGVAQATSPEDDDDLPGSLRI